MGLSLFPPFDNDTYCHFLFLIPRTLLNRYSPFGDLQRSVLRVAILINEGICPGSLQLWSIAGARSCDALLAPFLGSWMGAVLNCFVLSVENLVFGDDGL